MYTLQYDREALNEAFFASKVDLDLINAAKRQQSLGLRDKTYKILDYSLRTLL